MVSLVSMSVVSVEDGCKERNGKLYRIVRSTQRAVTRGTQSHTSDVKSSYLDVAVWPLRHCTLSCPHRTCTPPVEVGVDLIIELEVDTGKRA